MNTQRTQHKRSWSRMVGLISTLLALVCVLPLVYASQEYVAWRNKMIEWDYGTIDRLCGGDTEQDRLLEIRFVKPWEYMALERTLDGKEVWLHWKLSKRHCGNWMLVNKADEFVIRPLEVRFPNGAPPRRGFSCLGIPIDEKG